MHKSLKFILAAIIFFCANQVNAQDEKKLFTDKDGVYQMQLPASWKSVKARLIVQYTLEDPAQPKRQLTLEKIHLYNNDQLLTTEKIDSILLAALKEDESKGTKKLIENKFVTIDDMPWSYIYYISNNLCFKSYNIIYKKIRYTFYYIAPIDDYEAGDAVAQASIESFRFLDKPVVEKEAASGKTNPVVKKEEPIVKEITATEPVSVKPADTKTVINENKTETKNTVEKEINTQQNDKEKILPKTTMIQNEGVANLTGSITNAPLSDDKAILKEKSLSYFHWLIDVWDQKSTPKFNLLTAQNELNQTEIESYLKWLNSNCPYFGLNFTKNMKDYFAEVDKKWKAVPKKMKQYTGAETPYDEIFYDWQTITKLDGGNSSYAYNRFTKVFEPKTIINVKFYPNDEALISIPRPTENGIKSKSLDLLWKKENGEWKLSLTEFMMPRWKNAAYQAKLKAFYK